MKIVLFQQFYISSHAQRNKEIQFCHKCNLSNTHIHRIVLLNERTYTMEEMGLTSPKWIQLGSRKIVQHVIGTRLTYQDAVSYMKEHHKSFNYGIIANSDIFFNGSIRHLPRFCRNRQAICLGRYEYTDQCRDLSKCTMNHNVKVGGSQDAWIVHAPQVSGVSPRYLQRMDFPLGKPGCDNRIARVFQDIGWKPINPCKTIKSFHYHSSAFRTYTQKDRIPGPYLRVPPI